MNLLLHALHGTAVELEFAILLLEDREGKRILAVEVGHEADGIVFRHHGPVAVLVFERALERSAGAVHLEGALAGVVLDTFDVDWPFADLGDAGADGGIELVAVGHDDVLLLGDFRLGDVGVGLAAGAVRAAGVGRDRAVVGGVGGVGGNAAADGNHTRAAILVDRATGQGGENESDQGGRPQATSHWLLRARHRNRRHRPTCFRTFLQLVGVVSGYMRYVYSHNPNSGRIPFTRINCAVTLPL